MQRDIHRLKTLAQRVFFPQSPVNNCQLPEFLLCPFQLGQRDDVYVAFPFLKSIKRDGAIDVDAIKMITQRLKRVEICIEKRLNKRWNRLCHYLRILPGK